MLLKLNYKCQNSGASWKTESSDYKHYIFLYKILKASLTAHKSQICRILAYKWVIRLSPLTLSCKIDSDDYKYPITLKRLQTWLQKENKKIFSTWECCVHKHKIKLCKTPKYCVNTQKMLCVKWVGVCAIK